MNKMIFSAISVTLLLVSISNVQAGSGCRQEEELFNKKSIKVKPLYENCAESKLNSKACKQYSQEANKALAMMNIVTGCINASGDITSAVSMSFWDHSKEFSDDYEKFMKRSRLDAMEKM